MALIRPILATPPAFDANKDYTFSFSVASGGDQVVSNTLTIILQDNKEVVYKNTITSYAFTHTVPAGTLTNGSYYSASITTSNYQGVVSSPSNSVQFYCYTTPTFDFYEFPTGNIVQNSNYVFKVQYNQNEAEPLNSYIYNLYDSQKVLISTSGTKFVGTLTEPPNIIEYQFSGLTDETTYYIQAIGRTVNNTEVSTELLSFIVRYSTPNVFTVVELTNNCQGGYITVKSNLTSIEGISYPDPPIYVDDDTAVDLRQDGNYVSWQEGFSISGDFTASLWGRSFIPNKTIILLENKTTGESLVVNYREDENNNVYAELFVTSNSLHYYIFSEKISKPSDTDPVQIWFRRIGNLYNIKFVNLLAWDYPIYSDGNLYIRQAYDATKINDELEVK